MTDIRTGDSPRRARLASRCALLIAISPLAVGLAACTSGGNPLAATPYDAAAKVVYGTAAGGKADPNKPLKVSVKDDGSRITDVTATDTAGRYVRGQLSADGKRWQSTAPLAAGAHYTVRVSTEDSDGHPGRKVLSFDTTTTGGAGLHVTFGPDAGTYGVGQPITATLSKPVHDRAARAAVEANLRVSSVPNASQGSWYWVDDKTLHYRPQTYWPTHATITVRSTLSGVRVQDKLYGGDDKPLTLHTGDRIEAITDAGTDQMTFKDDGKVVKTMPITTGKPGFDTRNGIKVVLEKEQFVQMRSETVGIGGSDAYDLPVYWATRVTWSGEYVHAAPWSEGSQGSANVSHGCTGMSTENAEWFFEHVREGDIVRVINSHGPTMTPFDNGFGDWNLGWAQWKQGSALSGGGGVTGAPKQEQPDPDQSPSPDQGQDPGQLDAGSRPTTDPARLQPQAL
ncbi:L,D-transpeptidase [Actinacidiphila acidipaludis]|uniref:L,D-transpeptidase family protein n=1 Tax=Actinacidiphila acidipaludis TaxID=2873382 RepID=A0ABS7Q1A3_9ACTN|nr:Ig-like domain-containing protein [Streptomyces acidipaludis]MBY8876514.1 L,D-transpeptidase family protein [Streptomyces acidipaludis]